MERYKTQTSFTSFHVGATYNSESFQGFMFQMILQGINTTYGRKRLGLQQI